MSSALGVVEKIGEELDVSRL